MITTAADRVAIRLLQKSIAEGLSMDLSPVVARMWREMAGDLVEMIEEAPQGAA